MENEQENQPKKFVLVEFLSDSSIELVLRSWFVSSTSVRCPPANVYTSALQRESEPNDNWNIETVEILADRDTYDMAKRLRARFVNYGEVDSSDYDNGGGRRRHQVDRYIDEPAAAAKPARKRPSKEKQGCVGLSLPPPPKASHAVASLSLSSRHSSSTLTESAQSPQPLASSQHQRPVFSVSPRPGPAFSASPRPGPAFSASHRLSDPALSATATATRRTELSAPDRPNATSAASIDHGFSQEELNLSGHGVTSDAMLPMSYIRALHTAVKDLDAKFSEFYALYLRDRAELQRSASSTRPPIPTADSRPSIKCLPCTNTDQLSDWAGSTIADKVATDDAIRFFKLLGGRTPSLTVAGTMGAMMTDEVASSFSLRGAIRSGIRKSSFEVLGLLPLIRNVVWLSFPGCGLKGPHVDELVGVYLKHAPRRHQRRHTNLATLEDDSERLRDGSSASEGNLADYCDADEEEEEIQEEY